MSQPLMHARPFQISITAQLTRCDFFESCKSRGLIVGIVMQRYPPLFITAYIDVGAL